MLCTRAPATLDDNGLDPTLASLRQSGCIRLVTNNRYDLRRRDLAASNRIDKSHHIRPAAGDEYSDLHKRSLATESTEVTEKLMVYLDVLCALCG
jgi:hypothetical protein